MKDKDSLYKPCPPFVLVDAYTEEDKKWLPAKRYESPDATPVIRVLRGTKMSSYQGLMDEFGAALQFFEGFGENWPALEECLCYMDEWLPSEAYILEIIDGRHVLAEETDRELATFLRLLNRVGEWWSKPISDNPPHNRTAVPFHVVIKVPEAELSQFLKRLTGCGEGETIAAPSE